MRFTKGAKRAGVETDDVDGDDGDDDDEGVALVEGDDGDDAIVVLMEKLIPAPILR